MDPLNDHAILGLRSLKKGWVRGDGMLGQRGLDLGLWSEGGSGCNCELWAACTCTGHSSLKWRGHGHECAVTLDCAEKVHTVLHVNEWLEASIAATKYEG